MDIKTVVAGPLSVSLTQDGKRLGSVKLFGKEMLDLDQPPIMAIGLRSES